MDLITISNKSSNNSLSSIKLQNSIDQVGTGFNTDEMPASDIMTISSNIHNKIGNIDILENKLNLIIQRTKKLLEPSINSINDSLNGGKKINKLKRQKKKNPILVKENQQPYNIKNKKNIKSTTHSSNNKKYKSNKEINDYLFSDSIFTLNG